MKRLELATRRDFLGGIFSAGALVFAVGALPKEGAGRDVPKAASTRIFGLASIPMAP